ncbi:MAG TPA: hypothetical protein VGK73_27980 [Polyangiaceae bacterium]
MADNTVLPGTGETYASDDIGGVKFPRSKLIFGGDGVNSGDVSASNPLPVALPSGTSFVPSGVQLFNPTGYFTVQPPSGFAQPVIAAATGFQATVGIPSGVPILAPSGLSVTLPSGFAVPVIGTATGLRATVTIPSGVEMVAPSGVRAIIPSLINVGFATGIMQIVAPSGLAVTGNLSASIGTGVGVGLVASGLPVNGSNPLPVTLVSGGDGGVQGIVAHGAVGTGVSDPVLVGGYASTAAPSNVDDGDAVNQWFAPNGAAMVGLQSAGTILGAGLGVAASALRVTIARDSEPLAVSQASGTIRSIIANGPALAGATPTGAPLSHALVAHGATAVASGALVRPMADTLGKQVVLPGAPISDLFRGMAGVQGTGSRTVAAAPGSGISYVVTSIQAVNASPTYAARIVIHDGTATLHGGYCGERGGGFAPNGGQFPLFVATANSAIQAVALATGADIDVVVSGYRIRNP